MSCTLLLQSLIWFLFGASQGFPDTAQVCTCTNQYIAGTARANRFVPSDTTCNDIVRLHSLAYQNCIHGKSSQCSCQSRLGARLGSHLDTNTLRVCQVQWNRSTLWPGPVSQSMVSMHEILGSIPNVLCNQNFVLSLMYQYVPILPRTCQVQSLRLILQSKYVLVQTCKVL